MEDPIMDSFFFQLQRLRKVIFRRSSQLMNEAGIHFPMEQLPLLVILRKHKILSQRELSDITLRDKSSILRSVSALEKKGLVVIVQDSADKRKNNISLSPEGMTLAHTIKSLLLKAESEVLSVFSEQERTAALRTVRGYADRLENI